MKTVVKTSTGDYQVYIGRGLLDNLPSLLGEPGSGKTMIVTDDNVAKIYLAQVLERFPCAHTFIVPPGEASKSPRNAVKIAESLASAGFTRKDRVLALGGGVVGDLAGFVSSIYMRGIPYVQIPTTLLAGIDSSVGGKTAVNLSMGKNLLGRVYPPQCVIFDTDVLSTLPEKYFRDGVGEGLKYALLNGGELFGMMEDGLNDKNIERFAELCVLYKKRIVEADENESSARMLLNLGHTLGHAVERKSGFALTHGACVAIGLKLMSGACFRRGLLGAADYVRITALLEKYDFPECPYKTSELTDAVRVDKKTGGGRVNLITVHGVGDCRITPVELDKAEGFFS